MHKERQKFFCEERPKATKKIRREARFSKKDGLRVKPVTRTRHDGCLPNPDFLVPESGLTLSWKKPQAVVKKTSIPLHKFHAQCRKTVAVGVLYPEVVPSSQRKNNSLVWRFIECIF